MPDAGFHVMFDGCVHPLTSALHLTAPSRKLTLTLRRQLKRLRILAPMTRRLPSAPLLGTR